MNVIRRVYDRLTGVLGYDRRGKRIRAGDPVMLVGEEIVPELSGLVARVLCKSSPKSKAERRHWGRASWVRIEIEGYTRTGRCQCHDLVRLEEGDDASWRQVSESTGWKPSSITQPDEVPA
ncbi:hypothetical protein [Halomonas organivorans]|uniref:Uncharacterized protein n=1 Tax=Halomonas organivorans TaxID=257772 RepID=A0A7W5G721_9GAMM|nr:hypothetical protein [Halomonas organivorans]MBB3142804.1 hypothetical protein [Halomonas organivorans]